MFFVPEIGGSPDAGGVSGTAVKRYALLTPGGQKVRLDDDLAVH